MASLSDLFILNPKNNADYSTLAGFIPMNLVEEGYSGSHSFEQRQWGEIKTGYSHFSNGDIGIAKISPCFENRKSVIFNNLPNNIGSGTTELTVLRSLGVYSKFYLLLFKSDWYVSQGTKEFKGVVGQQRVNKYIFTDLIVPVPSLEEQKRIVFEVEKWFSLIAKLDESKHHINSTINIAKSKILDLAIQGKLIPQDPSDEPAIELLKRINPDFKPCDNSHYEDLPIGWSICTLYDICDTINGLWKGKNPPFVNVGVIRNANFTKDFNLDYSKIEYIDVEQRAFEKRNLEDGDLIVEKSGGSDNFPVGRSILYQGESGKYSFSNFTMALRIKDKNLIRSRYLYFVILHKYLSGEMRQMQTQTTGLHNLLSDKYMSMSIPIPPTKEQDRIIDSIEKLLNQMNKIKTVL